MISFQQVNTVTFHFEGSDIENFRSIVKKLIIESKRAGFKKLFTPSEIETISSLGETTGLNKEVEEEQHQQKD